MAISFVRLHDVMKIIITESLEVYSEREKQKNRLFVNCWIAKLFFPYAMTFSILQSMYFCFIG